MWRKYQKIQIILFSTYSLIILVVFVILVTWFYLWATSLLREHAMESMISQLDRLQNHVETELSKMNEVSLNVMYSNLVKNRFQSYMNASQSEALDEDVMTRFNRTKIESAADLAEILTAILGPIQPVPQLYLYDFQGLAYGIGYDKSERTYSPEQAAWYEATIQRRGERYIQPPMPNLRLSEFISSRETRYSISLFRLFFDTYNRPQGIIEVQQYDHHLFGYLTTFIHQHPYAKIFVFNDSFDVIYPFGEEQPQIATYMDWLKDQNGTATETKMLTNLETNVRELVTVKHSKLADWSMVLIVPESHLLKPLNQFSKFAALIALVILTAAIALSYFAAKKITNPIKKLHRTIRNTKLENLGKDQSESLPAVTGITELEQLHHAFINMKDRLKLSMDELLLAQSQEMQAKLVALQSQMNPHFLYNSLAMIHAMAEENMNKEVQSLSKNMADFLRYLSTDEMLVPLKTELEHTLKYLEINTFRFNHKLQYVIEVDPLDAQKVCIPKLIIQPLVENALKFATKGKPPWHIRIKAHTENNQWWISISDNGPGIQNEDLDALNQSIAKVNETSVIPTLKLGGMGLLNIYIRLKLTYGDLAIFRVEQAEPHGAVLTIGGSIITKEGDHDG